ncbi:MAG TPA: gluconate 2-dehydrogenase subunit 3 family protein [Gemmatimonadaceae bacterium]|nr:gluconate 2-dehydrogenase subunit 3 family protein [Gemmatimonadaceae bacterium]
MTSPQSLSRRGFLAAAATGAAAAWLAAHAHELEAMASLGAPSGQWLVLTADQAALLDAVTAQLIPSDDTPGAREAKVVRFIDRAFASVFKDDAKEFAGLLERLNATMAKTVPGATDFTALSDAQQVAVLKAFEQEHPDDFGGLRGVTILGMMSNPSYGGNDGKAGWRMIGFEDRYVWTPPFGWYDRG